MEEKQNYPKKQKKLRLKRGLGLKLIFYFIIFGLFLGGFVYFMSVVLDAGPIVRDIGGLISHKSLKTDTKADKIRARQQNINILISDLQKKYTSFKSVLTVQCYHLDADSNWQEVIFSNDNIAIVPIEKKKSMELQLVLDKKKVFSTNNLIIDTCILADEEDHYSTFAGLLEDL